MYFLIHLMLCFLSSFFPPFSYISFKWYISNCYSFIFSRLTKLACCFSLSLSPLQSSERLSRHSRKQDTRFNRLENFVIRMSPFFLCKNPVVTVKPNDESNYQQNQLKSLSIGKSKRPSFHVFMRWILIETQVVLSRRHLYSVPSSYIKYKEEHFSFLCPGFLLLDLLPLFYLSHLRQGKTRKISGE